jgi:hypothetical protein
MNGNQHRNQIRHSRNTTVKQNDKLFRGVSQLEEVSFGCKMSTGFAAEDTGSNINTYPLKKRKKPKSNESQKKKKSTRVKNRKETTKPKNKARHLAKGNDERL